MTGDLIPPLAGKRQTSATIRYPATDIRPGHSLSASSSLCEHGSGCCLAGNRHAGYPARSLAGDKMTRSLMNLMSSWGVDPDTFRGKEREIRPCAAASQTAPGPRARLRPLRPPTRRATDRLLSLHHLSKLRHVCDGRRFSLSAFNPTRPGPGTMRL